MGFSTCLKQPSSERLTTVGCGVRTSALQIGCKRFVACRGKKSDKLRFTAGSESSSARSPRCRTTWLSSSILLSAPCQRPTALIPATLPRSIHFFVSRLHQQSSECLIACLWQLRAPSSSKELSMGGSRLPGSLPVRAGFPCRPRSLQQHVAGVGDKRPGTVRSIRSVLRNLGGPCSAKNLRGPGRRCPVPVQHTASRLRSRRWRRNTER